MTNEMMEGHISGEDTLLVERTLRSGQLIKHSGNVVVLGDVNPGAEIIAGGHVVVMGSVRGVIHAGAEGDDLATVTSFQLNPTQLRIGNYINRSPEGDRVIAQLPEIARVKDGMIVIEKYLPLK